MTLLELIRYLGMQQQLPETERSNPRFGSSFVPPPTTGDREVVPVRNRQQQGMGELPIGGNMQIRSEQLPPQLMNTSWQVPPIPPTAMEVLELPQQIPTAIQPVGGGIAGVPTAAQEALQAPDIDPIDIAAGGYAFRAPIQNTLLSLLAGAGSEYTGQPSSVMAHYTPKIARSPTEPLVTGLPTESLSSPSTGSLAGSIYGPYAFGQKTTEGFPVTQLFSPVRDPKFPPPEYMYHGLGVNSWDRRLRSSQALWQQKRVLDQILSNNPRVKSGIQKGWFSDKPLPGYGPVYLAVKTKDLPQLGSWGNPYAKMFPGSGEAQVYTYRPWKPEPSSSLEELARRQEDLFKNVPPSKIMLADRTGKIIGPIRGPEAQSFLENLGKKLTEIIYPQVAQTSSLSSAMIDELEALIKKTPKP